MSSNDLKPIEFDVETTGFQPYSGHYPFMFQFFDGEDSSVILWNPDDPDEEARAEIQRWLDRSRGRGLRAWNSKFDFHFADSQGFELPPEEDWMDGMLEAHAIDERKSVALKAVSERLFGPEASDLQKAVKKWINDENARRRKLLKEADKVYLKQENLPFGETLTDEEQDLLEEAAGYRYENGEMVHANYSDVPIDLMSEYGLEDVFLTRKVCDHFEVVFVNAPDLKRVVEFERKVMPAIFHIEKRGLPADRNAYNRLEVEVMDNVARLKQHCVDLAWEGDFKIWAKEMGEEVEVSEDGRV
jgi:DNA polymerase I-like protein with 3'-5' exonuclease and polymerase domains